MQINRLMEMIYMLLAKESITAREFASRFNISTRTVYRDIDTMTLANIPVVMSKGKNGGISLLKNYKLDKAILSDSEKQAILTSVNIFGSIMPEGKKPVAKLKAIFGTSEDWLEIDFDNWSNENGQKQVFEQLKNAILNKVEIDFTYYSAQGMSVRATCPLKLCFKGQAWYLYAFCIEKKDFRFFKLNRLKNINVSNKHFDMQVEEAVLDKLGGYNDTFIEVTFKIAKGKAYRVYDEFLDITVLENGDFLVKCKFPQGEWLYQYISSFLGDCEVIEPIELKEKMREIYKKLGENQN